MATNGALAVLHPKNELYRMYHLSSGVPGRFMNVARQRITAQHVYIARKLPADYIYIFEYLHRNIYLLLYRRRVRRQQQRLGRPGAGRRTKTWSWR